MYKAFNNDKRTAVAQKAEPTTTMEESQLKLGMKWQKSSLRTPLFSNSRLHSVICVLHVRARNFCGGFEPPTTSFRAEHTGTALSHPSQVKA